MSLEENLAEDRSSSHPATTDQGTQTTPLYVPEDLMCTICLDTITDLASVSWCTHNFCFRCIVEWSSIRPVCPVCQQTFQYIYRKVEENRYDVYYLVNPNTPTSPARRERHQPRSEVRRRHRSFSRHRHRSSRRHRGHGSRASERRRSRSRSQRHYGRRRVQHTSGYESSSRRRQQQGTQDTAYEGGDSRSEEDILSSSGRSESQEQRAWLSSRDRQGTRNQSPQRSHSPHRRRRR